MKKRSKRYVESSKGLALDKAYTLKDAIAMLKAMKMTKFDQSVDLHFALNIDPKKPEQMIRGTVVLPHGTGKKSVLRFSAGENMNARPRQPAQTS